MHFTDQYINFIITYISTTSDVYLGIK